MSWTDAVRNVAQEAADKIKARRQAEQIAAFADTGASCACGAHQLDPDPYDDGERLALLDVREPDLLHGSLACIRPAS